MIKLMPHNNLLSKRRTHICSLGSSDKTVLSLIQYIHCKNFRVTLSFGKWLYLFCYDLVALFLQACKPGHGTLLSSITFSVFFILF
ncbi:hypothetical protein Hanom_Chr02g00157781 [Helianthus anomalus]